MNITARGRHTCCLPVTALLTVLLFVGCQTLPEPGEGVPPPTSANRAGRTSPGGTAVTRALPFPDGAQWVNTERALTMEQFKGRFVLLDFWTYGCVNCHHMVPNLNALAEEFPEELTVIGVHSGKFDREREVGNLTQAVERLGIRYPVVNDPDLELWHAYGVPAWPTILLFDPNGVFVGAHAGEWPLEAMRNVITESIEQAGQLEAVVTDFGNIDLGVTQPRRQTLLRYPEGVLLVAARDSDSPTPGISTVGPSPKNGTALYIADTGNNRLVIVDAATGVLEGTIGSGEPGFLDGRASAARFDAPRGMAMIDGVLYIADTGNHAIRRYDPENATITTVVQGDVEQYGDLRSPWDLLAGEGTLYVATAGEHQIWQVDPRTGEADVFAGSGTEGLVDGPAARAQFAQPQGLAAYNGALYVADAESSSLRRISRSNGRREVQTLVGRGLFTFGLEDGPVTTALLNHPSDLVAVPTSVAAADPEGLPPTIYFTDSYNNVVRRIRSGRVTQVTEPVLNEPTGLVEDGSMLWVADTNNHRIVTVDPTTGAVEPFAIRLGTPPGAGRSGAQAPIDGAAAGGEPPAPIIASVPDNQDWTLQIRITLPEGYKLNGESPNTVVVRSGGGDGRAVTIEPTGGQTETVQVQIEPRGAPDGTGQAADATGQTDGTGQAADVGGAQGANVGADTDASLTDAMDHAFEVELWLYFCETEDETVCLFNGAVYTVRVRSNAGADVTGAGAETTGPRAETTGPRAGADVTGASEATQDNEQDRSSIVLIEHRIPDAAIPDIRN